MAYLRYDDSITELVEFGIFDYTFDTAYVDFDIANLAFDGFTPMLDVSNNMMGSSAFTAFDTSLAGIETQPAVLPGDAGPSLIYSNFSTDFTTASYGGLRGTANGDGSLMVSGTSGTITRAYLIWNGVSDATDGRITNESITFSGSAIDGIQYGRGSDNCWGADQTDTYFADVTSYVTGDGTYNFSGMGDGANGATLVVVYDDGNVANNRSMELYVGNDSNQSSVYDAALWDTTLNDVEMNIGETIELTMIVGDGQSFDDGSLSLNGNTIATGDYFSGDVLPLSVADPDDSLWDVTTFDVSSTLSLGTNNMHITGATGNDCLSLVGVIVSQNRMPSPNADPNAQNDYFTTDEDTATSGNVLDYNGITADYDPNNDSLFVLKVNNVTADVGSQITLASGALVTLNSDGTFDYDPNGAFEDLCVGEVDSDSFTYTISDGRGGRGAATVFIEITGENEIFMGTSASETIDGSICADTIFGLEGDDILNGLDDDDILIGGLGADSFFGGTGTDTVSYSDSTTGIVLDLLQDFRNNNEADGDTFDSIEIIEGSSRYDVLRGDNGDNVFMGGNATDRMFGRAGDDLLMGEVGNDALYGNLGQDTMFGGVGNDRFIYYQTADTRVGATERDIIGDFESGSDRIEISRFDADVNVGGNQVFDFIGASSFSGTAGELRYFQDAGNGYTIIEGDVDGDSMADFQIELTGLLTLLASDFLL